MMEQDLDILYNPVQIVAKTPKDKKHLKTSVCL